MRTERKLKSNKGFTLVELVVVIAVLAILAGVGTVAYSGYIKRANDAADIAKLDAIKTAVISATVGDDTLKGNAITEITVTFGKAVEFIAGDKTYRISGEEVTSGATDLTNDTAGKNFSIFYTGDLSSNNNTNKSATWKGDTWKIEKV